MLNAKVKDNRVNGLDLEALSVVVEEIGRDPKKAEVAFRVATAWQGGTSSRATVESYRIGGVDVKRRFTINADEPLELLGDNSAPNPQELLMAAFNACIMVGYVAGASLQGITLEKVEIETEGQLDLRGFLGLDEAVVPGYEKIRYTVRIKGDGTDEQFREIHENVKKSSPNYFNISRPIAIESQMRIEA